MGGEQGHKALAKMQKVGKGFERPALLASVATGGWIDLLHAYLSQGIIYKMVYLQDLKDQVRSHWSGIQMARILQA